MSVTPLEPSTTVDARVLLQVLGHLKEGDFTARPGGGSRAELRASVSINAGTDKARRCAE